MKNLVRWILFLKIVIVANAVVFGVSLVAKFDSLLKNAFSRTINTITLFFVLEQICKIVAYGFKKYLRSGWNWFSGSLTLISGVSQIIIIVVPPQTTGETIPIFSALSCLTILRLLLLANSVKRNVSSLVKVFPVVFPIVFFFITFFYVFAVVGLEALGDLIADTNHLNFNNFGDALFTIFAVMVSIVSFQTKCAFFN